MSRLLVEIAKTLGKALIAGVGVEIARLAGQHLNTRLGPKKGPDGKRTPEELEAENQRLREELDKLRAAQRGGSPAGEAR
jgi:hypothetical protein